MSTLQVSQPATFPQRSWAWTITRVVRRAGVMVTVHLGALGLVLTEPSVLEWFLAWPIVFVRGLAITIGYHRYFSHHSFKTSRVGQFILGCLCCVNLQNGPLWWAAIHRHHHRRSDKPDDVHSPVQGGFFWGHMGWLFGTLEDPDWEGVRDLRRFPELVWLERLWLVPPILVGVACWLIGGWSCLCVDFFLTTVITMQMAFLTNSLGHLIGSRRFETHDGSRNSWVLAFWTLGDGWHNNHHHYPRAAQAGFFRGEIDPAFDFIRVLEFLGVIWDVRRVPHYKLNSRRLDLPGTVVEQAANPQPTPWGECTDDPTAGPAAPGLDGERR